jgi:hypothetical protein
MLLRLRPSLSHVVASSLLAMALVTTPANAAPRDAAPRSATPDDTAMEEAAKARYLEGIRLFKKRKWEEARAAFLQANALKKRPAATLMLAQSSLGAGRWLEAAREFDAYLAEAGEIPQKVNDLVENGRREARAHLGRIRLDIPEGAEVTIDGERVALPEAPVDVMPGQHTVVVTHREEKKTLTVDAVPGTTVEAKPSFIPKALVPTETTRSRPKPPPPPSREEQESGQTASILAPPATTWPVYAAGVIGLGGLATAAILGGLQANASHTVDVATETLTRNGKRIGSCTSGTGWATADGQNEDDEKKKYEETCLTLQRNEQAARDRESALGLSLIIGLSATALAAGWFFLAPKEHGE